MSWQNIILIVWVTLPIQMFLCFKLATFGYYVSRSKFKSLFKGQ